ncbi:hypothetical protein JL721_10060 [Aureococcus anophagefferens]|nr:hypothetical protein JL721_10060 [Aureococcus anophagefferens]
MYWRPAARRTWRRATATGPSASGAASRRRRRAALSAYGVYHWHASAVGALDCGDRGDVLLSGGSEAVLVVWQLRRDETEDRSRDFLPRLGGDVVAVRVRRSPAVLGGADLCLVVTKDRAAHLVALGGSLRRLWTRRSVETAPDAGLFDLGPLGVACNGKDGALQVIDEASDGVARTLDVVPHNRTSSAAAAAVRRPRVVLAAASRGGAAWRPSASGGARATGGQELKFWEADGRGGFAAAAVVRGPTARASPSAPSASTAPRLLRDGGAGRARVWVELDGAAGRWTCALTVAHCAGHGPPRQLCWSPDGSAVACHHDGVLAAWDPASGALLATLGAPDAAATALAAGFLTAADGEDNDTERDADVLWGDAECHRCSITGGLAG